MAARDPIFTTALLAGGLAGTTVDLSLFPLDTLKTRLQSSKGFIASGGFSGIYRGVGSAIVGSAPGAALFFVTYEQSKPALAKVTGEWKSVTHMAAASLGEIAACAVRVPTEVVKQRAQAGQHASSWRALKAILAQRSVIGLTGMWMELYRGWSVTIMREVPFTVIQFPLWEAMKSWRAKSSGRSQVAAWESAVFGSVSGGVAAAATTPLDVLKTRLMLNESKVKMSVLVRQIAQENGYKGFFAGIAPRIMWISAGGAIFLGSYQWAFNILEAK